MVLPICKIPVVSLFLKLQSWNFQWKIIFWIHYHLEKQVFSPTVIFPIEFPGVTGENFVPACLKGQCPPCRLRQKSSSRGPCTCELCLRQCLLPALPAVLFGLAWGVVTCYHHTIMVCLQCLRELCTCNSALRRAQHAQAVARRRQVRARQPSEPSASAHTRYATPARARLVML